LQNYPLILKTALAGRILSGFWGVPPGTGGQEKKRKAWQRESTGEGGRGGSENKEIPCFITWSKLW